MLSALHVYSSWYRLQAVEMDCALSEPKWHSSCLTMDSVDSNVPYRSNATTVSTTMVMDG